MSDTTIYILQKDLPENVMGTRFKQDPKSNNRYYPVHCFDSETGEYIWTDMPIYGICSSAIKDHHWFLPLKEVDEVESKEDAIMKARELLESEGYGVSDRCPGYPSPSRRYSEKDLRDAFVAARRTYFDDQAEHTRLIHDTVNDYLKSLNQ